MATATMVGAAAVKAGLTRPVGCVSALPDFGRVDLPGYGDLVFGGHDIAGGSVPKRAEQLVQARVLPQGLPELVEPDLVAADEEIRPGPLRDGAAPRAAVDAMVADLEDFRARHGLDRVVVVNVSSTETPLADPPPPEYLSLAAFRDALAAGTGTFPAGVLAAFAAFTAGCPFVDFTPSTGARPPALAELADRCRVPYAGSDGKTGETLVKSALAPMFARRALRVHAWTGTNLLGGGDGETLADATRAAGKIESKRRVLAEILDHPVDDGVHIHNVPELGEWKTAWDHIAFEGFLGARMTMQITWQGCDSALAAPLVLDLVRFTAAAHRDGRHGPLAELGFFFKDPLGSREHRLERQYETLVRWANGLPGRRS
ncbi:inositol-3-phosphate synthase [Actinomadura algeriensis]|uniref:Myo-inositol-1-phosphate synthase n=1 Tax=Actinomadura algeriensis TaxID=1679523 RepID=A0ABR9JTM4_9ACTN|nr:myo-inositol-1-phosphate synthase [Actinomadura algeriensis]